MEFHYYDISPLISKDLAVFPGDVSFRRKVSMDMAKGDNLGLSSMETSLHIGAHVDAPSHYHESGIGIHERILGYYMGLCQVIEVKLDPNERIIPDDFETTISAPRVLFKTNSFPDPNQWNGDFNSLSPELVEFLFEKGVRLIGIDTPSVDPEKDKELRSHTAIANRDMAILEGIVLTEVPDGLFNLVALPLKINEGDASPVRAILLDKDFQWG